MKHLKPFKINEISSPAGSIDIDISGLSPMARHNNANPAIHLPGEYEEEIDKKLNVYRVGVEGMDMIYYIIAAESIEEAHQIAKTESMSNVDYDDIFQITELQTNNASSGVIISF